MSVQHFHKSVGLVVSPRFIEQEVAGSIPVNFSKILFFGFLSGSSVRILTTSVRERKIGRERER